MKASKTENGFAKTICISIPTMFDKLYYLVKMRSYPIPWYCRAGDQTNLEREADTATHPPDGD